MANLANFIMEPNLEPIYQGPPSLVRHLMSRYVEESSKPDTKLFGPDVIGSDVSRCLEEFLNFADAEMNRNPVIATGHDTAGMVAHLADRTTVRLSMTRALAQRDSAAIPVTGLINYYQQPAPASQPIPITGPGGSGRTRLG
jgi:hypothetical protein